jgi:MerR family redox-sensitive transcriptional activator SoxR
MTSSALEVKGGIIGMLTIGEVAKRAGVRTSALRYYEDVGVLPPAQRVGGKRRYDEAVLARLAVVRLAQDVGFSVTEIRSLVAGFNDVGVASARWQELASRKLTEVDALIRRAEHMKQLLEESLGCGCLTLDACQLVLRRGDPLSSQQDASPAARPEC